MSALYRTYRPRDFDEVVGQRHVVQTLRNAVDHGRVRHAYLFAGPRGTGKTSLAKILAKSLNCLNADGPTSTPCKECESCRSIHDATALDVIELDAASNRGIDDIREIRERVAMRPAIGRRKVYILDEAHSLTTDASNALLKTLEEPPDHVVFVLCTTEPHKLLDTIKGRCQAFAFHRPGVDDIRTVLERVAAAESITIEPEAVALIARSARGSFRDAVSALDQLATACGGTIAAADARSLLGVVSEATLLALVDGVARGDAAGALRLLDDLVEGGQDLGQLVTDLLGHLRLLLLTRELGELPASAPVTTETRAAIGAQATGTDERVVVSLLDGLLGVLDELRDGGDVRLPLELVLVRVARPAADRSIEAILRRLDSLEAGHATAGRGPVVAPAPGKAAHPPVEAGRPAGESGPAVGRPNNGELRQIWAQQVLPLLRERRPSLASNVEVAEAASLDGGVLRLQFPSTQSFRKSYADTDTNRSVIAEAVATVLGVRVRIVLETVDAAPPPATAAEPAPVKADAPSNLDAELALIEGFVTEFDAHEIQEDP